MKTTDSLETNNFLLTKLLPDFGVTNGIFTTRTFAPDAPSDYTCANCGVTGVPSPPRLEE